MSTLLEVKNLQKYFKTPHGMLHAVDNVSFTLNAGGDLGRSRGSLVVVNLRWAVQSFIWQNPLAAKFSLMEKISLLSTKKSSKSCAGKCRSFSRILFLPSIPE